MIRSDRPLNCMWGGGGGGGAFGLKQEARRGFISFREARSGAFGFRVRVSGSATKASWFRTFGVGASRVSCATLHHRCPNPRP